MAVEMVEKSMDEMSDNGHSFTDKEKVFITEFAFSSGDKELTSKLVTDIASCVDNIESEKVMLRYSVLKGERPQWYDGAEALFVAIEVLRVEEEKYAKWLDERLASFEQRLNENIAGRDNEVEHKR